MTAFARALVLPLAGLTLASLSSAQVVYGTSQAAGDQHYLLDPVSTVSTGPVTVGQRMYGLADDDTNQLLYLSDEGMVFSWSYGTAAIPMLVVAPIDPANGNSIRSEGMAHNGGLLYGVDEFGAAGLEGIYSFDLVTGDATPVHIYTNADLDIGGLDVDPATGLFYGSSDASLARGITVLDTVALTETIISAYPGTIADIDGLAFNPNGTVYLIQDEAQPIDVYDVGTNTYTGTLPTAVPTANTFSAGTWSDVLMGPSTGIGTSYCDPAVANSTGVPSTIQGSGSTTAADNDVTLTTIDMPNGSFGYYLTSMTQGSVPMPNGSLGTLCLGGAVGRYVGAGQIMNTGMTGQISLTLDLTQHPTPTGLVTVTSGQTWNFQMWHRDVVAGNLESNFSNGLQITFN